MIFKFLKTFNIVKYIIKELNKLILINYLIKNYKDIRKILSHFTFLIVILFTMLSLSLYLETDVETFIKENNIEEKKTHENNPKQELEFKEKNLVNWGSWDISNNVLTKSESEPIGSYEQETNNDKIKHIPKDNIYELDWWHWPKMVLDDEEHELNKTPCRAGTKICNKLQNKKILNHSDIYTTSVAYKTAR